MPVTILPVRMEPHAFLCWAQRATPATVSLDTPDLTVAQTSTTVRTCFVLRAVLVKMGSAHSDVCATTDMKHQTALRLLVALKV